MVEKVASSKAKIRCQKSVELDVGENDDDDDEKEGGLRVSSDLKAVTVQLQFN